MNYCTLCGGPLADGPHAPRDCVTVLLVQVEIARDTLAIIQDETECPVARELATDALEAML